MHRIISVLSRNGKIEEESFLERFVRLSKVSRISCCAPVSLERISCLRANFYLYHIITRYFPNFIPPREGRQILRRVSSLSHLPQHSWTQWFSDSGEWYLNIIRIVKWIDSFSPLWPMETIVFSKYYRTCNQIPVTF